MLDFNHEMVQAMRKSKDGKQNMKSDLGVAMKQLEKRKITEKQNEAALDQLHKVGPPMMQEIDFNQRRIEEKTKLVN